MRINKLLKVSAMMAFLFMTNQPGFTKTTSQEAYDRYLSSYQAYQNAITEKKSKTEIKAALEAYNKASVEYKAVLGTSSNSNDTLIANCSANAPVATSTYEYGEVVYDTDALGIPLSTPKTSVIANRSDIQRELSNISDKLDKTTQRLVDELRETQDKKLAKEIIKKIEGRASLLDDKEKINFLKYEVATALDRLSIDGKKTNKLLNELIASKDPKFVKLANLNKSYIEAKAKKRAWQNDLINKSAELNNTKARYRKSSWLAFPVKLVSGAKALVANVKFTSNESDYEDYLVDFEAIQARYITNVEAVFNEWQAGIKKPEETADIRLVYDNYESWYLRWKLINSARSSIDMQYFIIENDAFGYSILGALLKKADEGIRIRLMVDTRGTKDIGIFAKGYLIELAKRGNVEVRMYNPISSSLVTLFTDVRKIESSNHDKIIIVDGEKSVTGGRNIANTYFVNEEDMNNAWRDSDVVVDSEIICAQMKVAFDEEFDSMKSYTTANAFLSRFTNSYADRMYTAYDCMNTYLETSELLKPDKSNRASYIMRNKMNKELKKYVHMNQYNYFNIMDNAHRCAAHIIDNNSLTGHRKDITENVVKYIDACRTELYIQNPYFALTDRAEAALRRAAARGIPIYISSNSQRSSDSAPTEAYVLANWKNMLSTMPTMRFFARNKDGQLHSKTFAFDGKVSIVGSYNFDALSEKVNSEICLAVKSPEFTSELRGHIMEDIEGSVEYRLPSENDPGFAPGDIEGAKNKKLTKILSKMGFLQPLF